MDSFVFRGLLPLLSLKYARNINISSRCGPRKLRFALIRIIFEFGRPLLRDDLRLQQRRLCLVLPGSLVSFGVVALVDLVHAVFLLESFVDVDFVEVFVVFLDELYLVLNLNSIMEISAILGILNSWL